MYPASLGLLGGAVAALVLGIRAEGVLPLAASIAMSGLAATLAVVSIVRPGPRGAHRARRALRSR